MPRSGSRGQEEGIRPITMISISHAAPPSSRTTSSPATASLTWRRAGEFTMTARGKLAISCVRSDCKLVRPVLTIHDVFGSDRSSRNANVRSFVHSSIRPSVRSVETCRELSIFIILAQIFKLTSCALSEINQSTQRAVREQSESYYSIKIRVNTVGASKYCVLLLLTNKIISALPSARR